MLELSYDRALADPLSAMRQVADFVAPLRLDVRAAAASVHVRSPKCLPDLAFELSTVTS